MKKIDREYLKNNAVARLGLLTKYFLHTYKNRMEMTGEEQDQLRSYQEKIAEDFIKDLENYFGN